MADFNLTKMSLNEAASFIIINSGYTSRLINRFKMVHYKVVDNKLVEDPEEPSKQKESLESCSDDPFYSLFKKTHEEQSDKEEDESEPNKPEPLFIYDTIGANGLYISPEADLTFHGQYILALVKLISNDPNCDGVVVCETNEENKADYLDYFKNLDYCQWYSVTDTEVYFNNGRVFAVQYNIDSESG